MVRDWIDENAFGKEGGASPWDAVPKRLYLPDGRAVPVCVVMAPPVPQGETAITPVAWPNATFGCGMPVHVKVQHVEHMATVGCLVSDGHSLYALTARHACGEPGTEVSVALRGGPKAVGVSTDKQVTRRLFSEVYPSLPLRQTWLGLDVGLVRVEDARDWTPNIYGLPPIRPLFDVYEQNLSLRRLLDQPVIAIGAASGLIHGRVKAFFYRYRSVGGYDYVSDFLIAPDRDGTGAHHGDSGALWLLQMPGLDGKEDTRLLAERDLRPLAIEWGSQQFAEAGERSTYSVATSLSNICKLLDVELVVEGGDALAFTWGATGHYSIATLAIDLVQDPTLKAFLQANADLVSVPLDDLKQAPKGGEMIRAGFVALADVPDIVWKKYPSPHPNRKGDDIGVKGGRDTKSSGTTSTGPEHATHHCDADMPFKGYATLPDACLADPSLLTAQHWNEYFNTFPDKVDVIHRGILPFRVWQFYERMKDYAAPRPERFLAAAGILAHYVGDASQPLHGSIYADGIEDEQPDYPRTSPRKNRDGTPRPAHRGEGVHSAYETQMIDWAAHRGVLFPEILAHLGSDHGLPLVSDGRAAALATLQTMHDVAAILPPRTIIDAFEETYAPGSRPHSEALWPRVGDGTAQVMAAGARTLAMLWDSAWAAGGGNANPGRIDEADLRNLYENPDFLRSVTVDEIEHEIAHPQQI